MPKRSIGSEDSEDDELRASSSGPCRDSPLAKKQRYIEFEPIRICSIGSVKEIDNCVLRAQHYKLCEKFRLKEKIRLDLEKRIEGFERRQIQDDAVMCIINRYWNRLDEEMQLLLQRLDGGATTVQIDAEMKDEAASSSQHDNGHFLSVLAQWSCEEMDEKLKQRVEFSQRSLAKLVQAVSRIGEQNGRIITILQDDETHDADINDESDLIIGEKKKVENSTVSPGTADEVRTAVEGGLVKRVSSASLNIDTELRKQTRSLLEENNRLQKLLTEFQSKNHRLGIKTTSYDDKVTMMALRVDSLTTEIEDLRYRLHKSMQREEKLDCRLAEYIKKQDALQISTTTARSEAGEPQLNGTGEELASLSKSKLEELQQDLEIQTELASNRLAELQEMTERNKSLSADVENCKMKLKYISSDDVKNSTEYKCLQTAFNSLFEDSKLQRKEDEELKQQIVQSKQTFEEQINSIKNDNLIALDRLQQTVIELDNDLNTARREYENVCVDYEVNTASREQAMPINEQMNALMNSLNTQNTQLKQEVARLKRKCTEMGVQIQMCQKELDGERRVNNENYLIIKLEDEITPGSATEGGGHNAEMDGPSPILDGIDVKKEEPPDTTSQNGQNSDQHRNAIAFSPPPPTDLAEAQKLIQRLRLERDRYRDKLRSLARADLKEKRKSWNEEQRRRLKHLEDQCERLRRELQSAKQEEDGLMQEMESTGQAFEELQEQHQKLVEQLREKDDVNLKLMSERIRSTQAQKKMRDERELLDQSVQSLENQLAAKLLHCQRLEEKERVLTENRMTIELELRIRDQNNETLRKKAMEFSQLATDLRLRLDRQDIQFTELRESVMKKASSYEANANKIKRLEEEKSSLKRKLERAKRMEKYENVDELLQEENRILKESLTCPSCKVNRKNAILDKCRHVFCFECIRLRYDNRRRKCPKCNAAFGANDFHRIYLE
ncbi:E3 ubiquitin-protein ligase BRE1B [Globodera pallida]|nr:E3 ubiquitin-protein ligase BRE1B [Globodera pallida]